MSSPSWNDLESFACPERNDQAPQTTCFPRKAATFTSEDSYLVRQTDLYTQAAVYITLKNTLSRIVLLAKRMPPKREISYFQDASLTNTEGLHGWPSYCWRPRQKQAFGSTSTRNLPGNGSQLQVVRALSTSYYLYLNRRQRRTRLPSTQKAVSRTVWGTNRAGNNEIRI